MASSRRRGGAGPDRVTENWERLVRASLKGDRDHRRAGPSAAASAAGVGVAAAVPPSLRRSAGPPTSSRSCRPPTTSRTRTPTSPGSGLLALGIIAGIVLLIVYTKFTIADLFASALAFIATGWFVLCLAVTWKGLVKTLGLRDSVREIARMYDAGMGAVIFVPIVFLSWTSPFVSTFQSRILFNQAFSRGLEISLILAGNKPNQDVKQ